MAAFASSSFVLAAIVLVLSLQARRALRVRLVLLPGIIPPLAAPIAAGLLASFVLLELL